jgi:DNA-binding CsgD family transcriptional regulator
MAAFARWYAGEVIKMMSRESRGGEALGLDGSPADDGSLSGGFHLLTRRELEIARLASGGYTAREIAGVLHISERTVENHIANVYAKLGINSRRALIKMAATIADR